MSERSYCPSAKRDALSHKLQTANREPCDSLRRGLRGDLSSYPRSRLSDHIKNLQRFPDTHRRHEIFLGHLQTCCRSEHRLPRRRDSPFTETVSQERRKPQRILAILIPAHNLHPTNPRS